MSDAIRGVTAEARGLTVTWAEPMEPTTFHWFWLRDNCGCAQCRHPQTWERTLDTFGLDPGVSATGTRHDRDRLEVVWDDGHHSEFDARWLYDHRIGARRDPAIAEPVPWDATMQQHLPEIGYDEVIGSDTGLCSFLQSTWTFGLTLVRNAPLTQDALLVLARRVGHLRETNFGVDWHVQAKPQPNNVAYTAIELQLHTDLPNREMPPGFQFLHCLAADAPGGDSTLADGFWVAEQIRRDNAGAFELLSTVGIDYRFHDSDHDLRWRAPVIGLDECGAVCEVRFHTALREPLDVPFELVEPMYAALRSFDAQCRSHSARISLHLEPGDVMVFHNRRVLHGRTAFDSAEGRRELHGVYVDADELLSTLRMLA